MGAVSIYVEIYGVDEYSHDNDIAHRGLNIGQPQGNNIVINETTGPMFINSYRNDNHNYIIENSTLTLNNTLFLTQTTNYEVWVVVKGTGQLVLNGGAITSDCVMSIYLSDDSNMTVYGQARTTKASGMVFITMDERSTLYVSGSTFPYTVYAPTTLPGSAYCGQYRVHVQLVLLWRIGRRRSDQRPQYRSWHQWRTQSCITTAG